MADLTEVWGASHGISHRSFNISSREEYLYTDLSANRGSISSSKPLHSVTHDSIEIINQFQNFQGLVKKIRDVLKKQEENLADFLKYSEGSQSIPNVLDEYRRFLIHRGMMSEEDYTELTETGKRYIDIQQKILDAHVKVCKDEIVKTKEELDDAEKNLAVLRSFLVTGIKEMIPESQIRNHICPICMEKDINRVLVPCGHTLCSDCSQQVGTNCMNCRAIISKSIPIYFSV
jgi:hypothetical protein